MASNETLNDYTIIDLVFMVEELSSSNETVSKEYIEKLVYYMNNAKTDLNSTQISWVLDAVSLLSSSIKENIEDKYYEIFNITLQTITNNKDIDSFLFFY